MEHAWQMVALVLLAPLAQGVTQRAKAGMQGRRGFPIHQPYVLLAKLMRRQARWPDTATLVMRLAPLCYLGAVLAAATSVPVFTTGSWGEFLMLPFALALGRYVLALAALDTATPFAGMGSSREMTLGALAEPAILAAALPWILRSGTTAWPALVQVSAKLPAFDVLRAAVLMGSMLVLLSECGRLPVDNPDTHLELTMIHEGMVLEYSGPPLAWILMGSWTKQLLLVAAFSDLTLPWGLLGTAGPAILVVPAEWLCFLLGMAVIESYSAKVRFLQLPSYLGASILLSASAVLLQFAGVR